MGENSGLSASDVLALDRSNGDMFSGGGAFFWVFALLLLNNGAWGGGGNSRGVTDSELAISQNMQTQTLMNSNIQQDIANVRYDLAQALGAQTDTLINQNNANLINAIQGFNNIGLQITNQTNTLNAQLAQISAQMNECCCSIKTQMLQDRYEDERAKNVTLQNALDNANQSQYILGQLGRFVAWAGSGSQAAAVATG